MIPVELLYIVVGAAFSAVASFVLQFIQNYSKSNQVRRALLEEMRASTDLVERIGEEDYGSRPTRMTIQQQLSTKMYDHHLSDIGRLDPDEITPIIGYYRKLTSIQELYDQYDLSKDQVDGIEEDFGSYVVGAAARNASTDFQNAEREMTKRLDLLGYVEIRLFGLVETLRR